MSSPEPRLAGPRIAADLVGGMALLGIAAVFLLKAGEGRLDWLLPVVLSYGVGILGVLLVVRGLLGYGDRVAAVPPILRGQGVDVAVFIVLAVIYVLLASPVGFWTMSALMIFSGSVYLDVARSRRNLTVSVLAAAGICVVGYFVLTQVFYIPMPRGQWLPF